jgi:hypothetical protein
MNEPLAYCGLDCSTCDALIATRSNDDALRARTAAEWTRLFGHEFKPADINCTGCRSAGIHVEFCEKQCEVRKCARGRGVQNCGLCPDFACATLTAHFQYVPPEAKTRLEAIRAGRKP